VREGDRVEIKGTTSYNGKHVVLEVVSKESFTVMPPDRAIVERSDSDMEKQKEEGVAGEGEGTDDNTDHNNARLKLLTNPLHKYIFVKGQPKVQPVGTLEGGDPPPEKEGEGNGEKEKEGEKPSSVRTLPPIKPSTVRTLPPI